MSETVIRCLCCHDVFPTLRALHQHRGPDGDGTDEGEIWIQQSGWSQT